MKHRPEIGRFCFCCKMFDRKTGVFFNIFADFVSVVINGCYVFYTSCCSWSMPRVNHRLVRTVYWAGIFWHVLHWHVAYFDRTVHVYWALIGRPTNMRNLKKKLRTTRQEVGANILGGNILTRGILTRGSYWSDGPRLPSRNLPCRNDFCVSAVLRMESSFLCLESAFFFFCLSRPQDCSDCDWELQTVSLAELPDHPGKFLRKWGRLPRGIYATCQLLIGRHRFEAYSACHMAKLDMWYHLIGPRGTSCLVSSADWSVSFLMHVGVDTCHTRGRY
jgi:Uri superfamily endonuclease